ncbi:MAG: hypothetical protein JOZ81_15055 [Chloroflexi bacterium]|nr:hypothetical protein [Chloroflexota bacterium]
MASARHRLALEVAQTAHTDFADGTRFVDLSPFEEPGLVLSAICTSVDASHTGSRPVLEALKRYLQHLDILLVLDNFEQATAAAPYLAELLSACPCLKILATSRVRLRLTWEHELPRGPLDVPHADSDQGITDLMSVAAVALLVERIDRLGEPRTYDHDDLSALAAICRRLDGMPLAIELTAARARLLEPRALLDHLESPLDLLTGGRRDAPKRQQSLRLTFDWSYDLLHPEDQQLFRSFGVFAGGCTLEAVSSVYQPAGIPSVSLVDSLERLIENGFVRRVDQAVIREPRWCSSNLSANMCSNACASRARKMSRVCYMPKPI